MSTVRMSPNTVNVCDILEYALAAIDEYGWRQGARQTEPANQDNRADWEKQVLPAGLSLHDAVGYACVVLSGASGTTATPARSPRSSKDFAPAASSYGYSGTLRERAAAAISRHLPAGETDVTFNDSADDVEAVRAVLRAAMREECN